jgi:GAF domain-containing protein
VVPITDDDVVRVAEAFGDIARVLAAAADMQATYEAVVGLAAGTLAACDHAGISLVQGRVITSPASTGETPARVDSIQTQEDEGPCLDAIRQHELFYIEDIATEHRWPTFTRRVIAETDVRSILSARLYLQEHTIGCLNLYATATGAFGDHDVALAAVFAAHAAVALDAAQREQHLEAKAASRDAIGRAKGILTAHSGITDDAAFDLLRRASQRENIKLVDIANRINDQQTKP